MLFFNCITKFSTKWPKMRSSEMLEFQRQIRSRLGSKSVHLVKCSASLLVRFHAHAIQLN